MNLGRGLRWVLLTLMFDTRSAVRATRTLCRHLRKSERVDVGLGMFSARAALASPGQPQQYDLSIANACAETRDIMLRVDIHAAPSSSPDDGHLARLATRLAVGPRSLCRVEIHYDWVAKGWFVVDGATCRPDTLWRGEIQPTPLCSVRSVIYDEDGRQLDGLTIYQAVAR